MIILLHYLFYLPQKGSWWHACNPPLFQQVSLSKVSYNSLKWHVLGLNSVYTYLLAWPGFCTAGVMSLQWALWLASWWVCGVLWPLGMEEGPTVVAWKIEKDVERAFCTDSNKDITSRPEWAVTDLSPVTNKQSVVFYPQNLKKSFTTLYNIICYTLNLYCMKKMHRFLK